MGRVRAWMTTWWRLMTGASPLGFWRYVGLTTVSGTGVALLLSAVQVGMVQWLLGDIESFSRSPLTPSLKELVGMVVVAPLIETLMLAAGLHLLSKASTRPLFPVIASALMWGVGHAALGLTSFLPVSWSFFYMDLPTTAGAKSPRLRPCGQPSFRTH